MTYLRTRSTEVDEGQEGEAEAHGGHKDGVGPGRPAMKVALSLAVPDGGQLLLTRRVGHELQT